MNTVGSNTQEECCGCRACEHACPQGCITMQTDIEGFLYPMVDKSRCTECGVCVAVCPMLNVDRLLHNESELFLGAVAKDKKVLLGSSSGGAFHSICSCFPDDTIIFGAEFSENLVVQHGFCEGVSGISRFQKSKYVQSDTGDSYTKVRGFLEQGRRVVFSGTPCQVAGLRSYLGKGYKNLFTVDLVCHGVPSQLVFDRYLKELSEKRNTPINYYSFREKRKFLGCWEIGIKFGNNRRKLFVKWEEDNFMCGFFRALFYRPACYQCPFANRKIRRVSDITLADFWGGGKICTSVDELKGVSLIVVNTKNGHEVVSEIGKYMKTFSADKRQATENNHNLTKPTKVNTNRGDFFEKMARGEGFNRVMQGYALRKGMLLKFKIELAKRLPEVIVRKISGRNI